MSKVVLVIVFSLGFGLAAGAGFFVGYQHGRIDAGGIYKNAWDDGYRARSSELLNSSQPDKSPGESIASP